MKSIACALVRHAEAANVPTLLYSIDCVIDRRRLVS